MTQRAPFFLAIALFTVNAALDMPNLVHLFLAVLNLSVMLWMFVEGPKGQPKK